LDYDFNYDEDGRLGVQLEMGQEATALWLNNDILHDRTTTLALLEMIDDLNAGVFKSKTLTSRGFEIEFSEGEVEVRVLSTAPDDDEFDEEVSGLFASEQLSGCGLEDLAAVLEGWVSFRNY